MGCAQHLPPEGLALALPMQSDEESKQEILIPFALIT